MASFDHVIRLSLVLGLSAISASFRIRRSGVAGYDDPYGLTNAFNDMDRPRRDDYRNMLRQQVLDEDDSYFNPNSVPLQLLNSPSFDNSQDNYGYIPEYMFEKSFQSYAPIDEYPVPYSGYGDKVFPPQKRTAYSPHKAVPTLEELRTLFGEADVPMKRLPPVKRQEPPKPPQESANEPVNSENDESTAGKDGSKEDAVRKLIVAAEKLTVNGKPVVNQVQEEMVKEKENGEGLVDIFRGASIDENGQVHQTESEHEVPEDENDDIETDEDDDVQTDGINFFGTAPAQSKSKRASNSIISSEYVKGLLSEISDLKQKVGKLEVLHMLEGKENDYLANALKFATLDQIEDKDAFISREYNDITKATETEALIQQLIDGEDDVVIEDDEDAAEEELLQEIEDSEPLNTEGVGLEVKRAQGEQTEPGQWLDRPVQDDAGVGAIFDDAEDDVDDQTDDVILDQPFFDDVGQNEDDEEEEEEVKEVAEAMFEEQAQKQEAEQKHMLANLLSNLSPSTVESIVADLRSQVEEETDGGDMCASVLELSNHCAFADMHGIPVNDDARELCVRHQICYTCGSAIGIPRSSCDEGYSGTVTAACGDDASCMKDAVVFLKLMTHYHDYRSYGPTECRNPCVQDFIYGVA